MHPMLAPFLFYASIGLLCLRRRHVEFAIGYLLTSVCFAIAGTM